MLKNNFRGPEISFPRIYGVPGVQRDRLGDLRGFHNHIKIWNATSLLLIMCKGKKKHGTFEKLSCIREVGIRYNINKKQKALKCY